MEAVPAATYADLQTFQRAPMERRDPNHREAKRIAKLQAQAQEVATALQDAIDADDEDKADRLHEAGYRLSEQLNDFDEQLRQYSPTMRAAAGAIVTIDRDGEAVIHRGLLRDAEAKALRALAHVQAGTDPAQTEDAESLEAKPRLSEKLTQRLSAHRTAALQIELARHPQAALAALVHGLVRTILQGGYVVELPIGVKAKPQDGLESYAADYPQSPAAVALRELRQAWGKRLPEDDVELFAVLLALPQDELVRLLAVCVASTVDVVSSLARDARGELLAQAVGLDMRAWWAPTAEGYFNHVSKAVILGAAQQFAPSHVSRLSKLKKAEIAGEAERLVQGSDWMPTLFTSKDNYSTRQEDVQENRTREVPENVAVEAEQMADTLAA